MHEAPSLEPVTERVEFENGRGQTLAARLERPAATPKACALFAHCFTCSKDVHAATRVSRALTRRGYAVLRFDFTGLGHSEGEFANENFSSNVEDLLAASAWLATHHGAPRLLVGHSLGGAAVLAAAGHLPSVLAVATIAAPSAVGHLEDLLGSRADRAKAVGEVMVNLGGRTWPLTRQFLDDLENHALLDRVRELQGRALLLYHAPADPVVGIEHAKRLFEAAHHPKSFLSLDDADHLLSRPEDAEYVAATLAAWASRYMDDDA